ncbi:MAG: glycosyltransferase family 4 protein [Rhodoferax sp.]
MGRLSGGARQGDAVMPAAAQKVLLLIGHQAFSLVNFRADLIRALVAQGVRVVALAPDFDAQTRAEVQALGATAEPYYLNRTGTNALQDSFTLLQLALKIRQWKPAALLCYSTKPVILGTLAGALAGVPRRVALIEGMGYSFTPPQQGAGLARRALQSMVALLFRLALARAHRVLLLNPDDLAEMRGRGLVGPSKTEVLDGIGVDLAYWRGAGPQLAPLTFVLAARLLVEKGVREYVAAARLVKAACPTARFLLLGGLDSNPGALAAAEVHAWVQEGVIEWPGHVEVKPWLARASVFVLPSYREGLPRSTQEAMAMGLPIITTDVPGCRATVVPGDNGYLVAAGDATALAAAMQQFVDDPQRVRRMGARSLAMAEQRFDVHQASRRIIATLALS